MKSKVLFLFISTTIAMAQISAQVSQMKVGDNFDSNEIITISGEKYNLDETKNKIFLMNFWNIGCKGCELERPYLNEVYRKFRNSDIVFWSITLNKQDKIESFLANHPIEWEFKGDVDFMGLTGDQTFLIQCMPSTIIVDKEGKIIYSKCGAIIQGETGDEFQQLIYESLNN